MWRRKRNKQPGESLLQDKAAKNIAGFILTMQKGFARFMGKRTERFGKRRKVVLLAVIILLFGGLSVRSVVRVFTSPGTAKNLMPDQIRVPEYESGQPEVKVESVPEDMMEKVKVFRGYMDSLQRTKAGKLIYDSILQVRPGLMDSVKMLEGLYYLQQQKK